MFFTTWKQFLLKESLGPLLKPLKLNVVKGQFNSHPWWFEGISGVRVQFTLSGQEQE